jgi:hypothetical protein
MDMFLLPMPARNATAFQFVELDWNPKGHGAPYLEPHFDFHFYTTSQAERDAILPSDPQYAVKAAHAPPAAEVPQFYASPAALLGIPPVVTAVPQMGMHWVDVRSPELQGMLGHPEAYRPFTKTFIYGAWDGRMTFMEPMITRAYIMAKRDATDPAVRDEVIPIPTSAAYPGGTFRPRRVPHRVRPAGPRVPHRAHADGAGLSTRRGAAAAAPAVIAAACVRHSARARPGRPGRALARAVRHGAPSGLVRRTARPPARTPGQGAGACAVPRSRAQVPTQERVTHGP